jgi:hypothetical protein
MVCAFHNWELKSLIQKKSVFRNSPSNSSARERRKSVFPIHSGQITIKKTGLEVD